MLQQVRSNWHALTITLWGLAHLAATNTSHQVAHFNKYALTSALWPPGTLWNSTTTLWRSQCIPELFHHQSPLSSQVNRRTYTTPMKGKFEIRPCLVYCVSNCPLQQWQSSKFAYWYATCKARLIKIDDMKLTAICISLCMGLRESAWVRLKSGLQQTVCMPMNLVDRYLQL